MRLTKPWLIGGGVYVTVVTTLTGVAMADPDRVVLWAWLAALAMTVPTLVVLVPAIYVVIPLVWHITDIDHSGPRWPTTIAYMVCFCAAASVNVLVIRFLVTRRRRRTSQRAPSASATSP